MAINRQQTSHSMFTQQNSILQLAQWHITTIQHSRGEEKIMSFKLAWATQGEHFKRRGRWRKRIEKYRGKAKRGETEKDKKGEQRNKGGG